MPRLHTPWHPYAGRSVVTRDGKQHEFTINDTFAQRRPHTKVTSTYSNQSKYKRSAFPFKTARPHAPVGIWQYRPGMKLGRGVSMRDIRRFTEGTGKGNLEDPKVLYNTDVSHVSSELIQQCEIVVKAEARRLGMSCCIIRGDLHNTTRTLDVWTKELIMVEDPRDPSKQMPLLEPLDDHLTVSFGTVMKGPAFAADIQLQGHIFVNVERQPDATSWVGQRHESGLILSQPLWKMSDDFANGLAKITGKLPPWKRRHIQDGYEECSEEYWEKGSSLKRNPYNFRLRK